VREVIDQRRIGGAGDSDGIAVDPGYGRHGFDERFDGCKDHKSPWLIQTRTTGLYHRELEVLHRGAAAWPCR
jgi:hypothetical protein